jgi:hypothetical protein
MTPSLKLTTHKSKKTTHFNSQMTTSQVLQKTTTPLYMVHPVKFNELWLFFGAPSNQGALS